MLIKLAKEYACELFVSTSEQNEITKDNEFLIRLCPADPRWCVATLYTLTNIKKATEFSVEVGSSVQLGARGERSGEFLEKVQPLLDQFIELDAQPRPAPRF